MDEAAGVLTMDNTYFSSLSFENNTQINSFDEFRYFTGIKQIGGSAFSGCSSLESIVIPTDMTTIGTYAFSGCSALASIKIPGAVTSIGHNAFKDCNSLTSVTMMNATPLTIGEYIDPFPSRQTATLYVPKGSKSSYASSFYWKDFQNILEVEPPKCAMPTISLVGGKLHFECETEGVQFHYEFTTPASGNGTGNDVDISSTYVVSVYASKEGYADSDVATANINVAGQKGDADGNGVVDIADAVHIVNYIVGKVNYLAPRKDSRQSAVH